ncbi:MAG TPA: 1-acyl-sn-glycerol-3-phosphate acyltransferase [Thermoanaerobaculia bacterium]|jgi:1-acyl-sn-glycerol-3-phosphate acyltransferase/nucleoside-diphosphate-sugar epimerase|nr:1-acyl-sn-glycerol-3-phosphate acyltransferase [Thermoanaerobaculia bacterium]
MGEKPIVSLHWSPAADAGAAVATDAPAAAQPEPARSAALATALLVGGRGPLTDRLAAALGEGTTAWRSPGLPAPLAGDRWERPVVYVAAARAAHGLPDPADAELVLTAAARAGASRVVVIASTAVHEPSPHHPGLVEERRWRPRRSGNRIAAAWLDLERTARAAVPRERLLVLRVAPVPLPGGDDFWSRQLFSRLTITPLGWDPMVQLLAFDDLVAALRAAVGADLTGTFHVAPAPAPARRAARSAGALRLAVPTPLLALARRLAGRPSDEVQAFVHSATVSAAAFERATGFAPRWSTLQAARKNRGEEPAPAAAEDPFGFDLRYRERLGRTLFRFLHRFYWRVDARGLEHVPKTGRAVLVGVHRGFQPWDGVMAQQSMHGATGRYARFLMHPGLVKMPFLAPYMTRIGGFAACRENGDWLLAQDELLGIFPEGIRGAFTRYRDSYRLTPWFRDEFAEIAIRNQAPIVPFVTIGTAETFPILGRIDWEWWKRQSLWPYLPITTPVPLPAKWHTRVLPPVSVDRYTPEDADDPAKVAALAAEVREQLAAALAGLLARRRHRFFGALAAEESS